MEEYADVLMRFLPSTATILQLQKPEKKPAILLADIDGDHKEEIIGAYNYQGQNYIKILKNNHNEWVPIADIKGSGYGITNLVAVPLVNKNINTLIVGWQIGSIWSKLDLLQWTNKGFIHIPTNNMVYSKLQVEDMPSTQNSDGKYELAIWIHDTGDAYKITVYRINDMRLVKAKDVYPYYFKKVEAYYKNLLKNNDYPFYWYYLSDAQMKAGDLEQALISIDKTLSLNSPYPSKETLLEKRRQILNKLKQHQGSAQIVIDKKRGDVTGDGLIDTVLLTAEKTEGSPYLKNITLVVFNEKTNFYEQIPLKENSGYNPTISLGDYTGNGVEDILVVIDSGGSGGIIFAYIFTYVNGEMRQVFDSDAYNELSKYEVNYLDNYKVSVTSSYPAKKYILDLTYKGKEYLSEIYNVDGTLKAPIQGWVDPISGFYPIDYARDGNYEFLAYQEIAGRYHADGLGYVETILKWNGQKFVPDRQTVSIFGEDLQVK
ncbi:hypothetical protein ACQKND_06625 [Viridibacillus arvi]|uniref:hypothetical protein n=1 Tax=Viridibacillus arvi TaxID=263475 RepID=UPI003CFE2844